jgi:hypothetical protein
MLSSRVLMSGDLFDLGPDASDRSRFTVFGRLTRRAPFVAVADPRRDRWRSRPLLIALGDAFADGAIFFPLGDARSEADAARARELADDGDR